MKKIKYYLKLYYLTCKEYTSYLYWKVSKGSSYKDYKKYKFSQMVVKKTVDYINMQEAYIKRQQNPKAYFKLEDLTYCGDIPANWKDLIEIEKLPPEMIEKFMGKEKKETEE